MKTLSFRDDMAQAVRDGTKTATSRTKKYGDVGDLLATKAGPVRLTRVVAMPLGEVAAHFYQEEGFESPEAFRVTWAEIHPRVGFRAEQRVYVHFFTSDDGNGADS